MEAATYHRLREEQVEMIAKPHDPNGLDAESAVVAALGEVADI
ncbi:hypothetical protein [Roseovarius arcticus]|nr:hypothetical protein [Roseovarius arcticus]